VEIRCGRAAHPSIAGVPGGVVMSGDLTG
jgi:hypothetical protein